MPALTLVVPQLVATIRSSQGDLRRYPALETVLARGERTSVPADAASYNLGRFGLDQPDLRLAPLGPLCRLGDGGEPDEGWWLCAAPVHLLPERDRLFLLPLEETELSLAEAQQLGAEFNDHFGADGWQLETPAPTRWYLRLDQPEPLSALPLEQVGGGDLRSHLPGGREALRWHARLNEVQMLFHKSAVNSARELRGHRPVGGLWLWGGGVLPPVKTSLARIWGGGCLERGLARAAGIECDHALPTNWPAALPETGELLAVLPQSDPALAERHLAMLLKLLGEGRLARLSLLPGEGRSYSVDRGALRRWWRRPRPLQKVFA